MSGIYLSIVIGAYSEATIIEDSLSRLAEYLKHHPELGAVEVVVVTADSPDNTRELVRVHANKFAHFQQLEPGARAGKGRDIKIGMMAAKGRYKLFMDADLATPLDYLKTVHNLMQRRVKVAIAVRDLIATHKQLHRKLITATGNALARLILLPGVSDTQCGFKLFEATAAQEIFSRQTIMGWGFDLEILAIARHLGYQVETIPVPDWSDPKAEVHGLVGDSAAKAATQSFIDLLVVKRNLLLGRYKPLNPPT